MLAGVLLASLGAVPAVAGPSASDVEKQIDDAWNTLEPIIEQYNKVNVALQQTQSKIDTLKRQIDPLQMRVDLMQTRVGAISGQLYRLGPHYRHESLLSTGSPATLLDQLTMVNELARAQNDEVAQAAQLRDSYLAQRKPLDALAAQLSAQTAQLAAQKKTIQARIDQLQQLRQQVYGSNGQALGNLRPVPCPVQYYGDKGSLAAKRACHLIGIPYVWGQAGPNGYDCSGLVLAAWASVGVKLDHYTGAQWNEGTPVARADLRPGDIVFFWNDLRHDGIYVGDGWMVNAPKTGDVVRMAKIDNPYMPIAGFRRPFGAG